MPNFCKNCNNLMIISTTPDSFQNHCVKCQSFEQPSDNDTLVYEEETGTNLITYKAILHRASRDPLNPKVRKECKCGNKLVRQVRLGDEMRLINACIKCNNQWVDGTLDTDNEVTGGKQKKGKMKVRIISNSS